VDELRRQFVPEDVVIFQWADWYVGQNLDIDFSENLIFIFSLSYFSSSETKG